MSEGLNSEQGQSLCLTAWQVLVFFHNSHLQLLTAFFWLEVSWSFKAVFYPRNVLFTEYYIKNIYKKKKKIHFRTVSDFLHLEALSFIWDRFVSAFTVHVWSNVSLSALASVVNLRRVLSPSAAAWLTCPRWSRHRTSLRCLLWCQTNNTTGERRTWRNHANEPCKERSKENGSGANLVTNVALWKVEIVVWIFDNCYNVLIQFIWLLLQLQEKLYFWPRGPVYVLNISTI